MTAYSDKSPAILCEGCLWPFMAGELVTVVEENGYPTLLMCEWCAAERERPGGHARACLVSLISTDDGQKTNVGGQDVQ